uniref:Uncharacterized protein n=1 Tax=Glossina austeni TaxID=7395 RepID=A0A1A9UHQ4_GLOAU
MPNASKTNLTTFLYAISCSMFDVWNVEAMFAAVGKRHVQKKIMVQNLCVPWSVQLGHYDVVNVYVLIASMFSDRFVDFSSSIS